MLFAALAVSVLPAATFAGIQLNEKPSQAAGGDVQAATPAELIDAARIYWRAASDYAPGMVEPLIDYAKAPAPRLACDPAHQPATYVVAVAADDLGIPHSKLQGPRNDVDLLSRALHDNLNVPSADIRVLEGQDASRQGLAAALLDVLAKVTCGDRVLLHFSGHGVTNEVFAAGSPWFGKGTPYDGAWTALNGRLSFDQLRAAISAGQVEFPAPMRYFAENAFGEHVGELAIMLDTSPSAEGAPSPGWQFALGRDISDYMIAVRNRGADMFVILDTSHAGAARLTQLQREAGDDSFWSYAYGSEAPEASAGTMRLAKGHGGYAVFYASGAAEHAPELRLPRGDPDAHVFGLFSYALAGALSTQQTATPASIARHVGAQWSAEDRNRPHPVIEASDPDIVVAQSESAAAAAAAAANRAIRILSPKPTRGAIKAERPQIKIDGLVDWPSRVLNVDVGGLPARLTPGGHFSATVNLKNGLNTVDVIATTADPRLLRRTLEFVYQGDINALEGQGKRYVVVIANQDYGPETGLPSLETPLADAQALADELTSKYGFTTELDLADGRKLPLFLKDPGKNDILFRLEDLAKNIGPKDTVLIYYAGHGVYEKITGTAYWVPSDARVGYASSFLSADDISDAIKRMQAGNVLLISNSCYSGDLMRGVPQEDEKISDADRNQALLRLQARRSRILMTSGNNEPVEDLGGGGHSIFAKALLDGLENEPHDAFSARELYDGYILQQVTANADQEPQFRPLEKVGHEGGDFVFVRSKVRAAGN